MDKCGEQTAPIPIFVLTIDQPGGLRRQHCISEFGRLNLTFNFVNGVTGDAVEAQALYSSLRNLLLSKRSLSDGEIAAYYGHRKAWQTFLQSGAPVALITEDDLSIVDAVKFSVALRHAYDCDDWDILKFFDYHPKRITSSIEWHGLTLVEYKYPASGNVAYIITRKAAERLLARKKIFRPVDEDFSCCWEFGLRVMSIFPNIVAEVSEQIGGSTLEAMRVQNRRKNLSRSVWGIVLQGVKQIRAWRYRRNINPIRGN